MVENGDLLTLPPLIHRLAQSDAATATVGVIGGGCAGYVCVHDLARLGYAVTIYELLGVRGQLRKKH